MPGYDPDYGKYVDVFEPDKGMFLISDKDIDEQPKDYFYDIREKMDQHYDKKFEIESLEGKGLLVVWESYPDYRR
jgi:hypothetical protein